MSALKCEKEYKYTENEIRYCDGIVLKGMSQREAYLYAGYSNQKGNLDRVDVKASQLASKAKVKARLEDMSERLKEKKLKDAIWSMDDSVRALKGAYELARESSNINGVVNAIKELNSMFGFNKQNINNLNTELSYEDYLKEIEGGDKF